MTLTAVRAAGTLLGDNHSSPAALPGSAIVVISSQKFNLRFCTDHYGELPLHWSTLAVIPA